MQLEMGSTRAPARSGGRLVRRRATMPDEPFGSIALNAKPQAKRPFARRVAASLASGCVARQSQSASAMLLPRALPEAKLAATECILSHGLGSRSPLFTLSHAGEPTTLLA